MGGKQEQARRAEMEGRSEDMPKDDQSIVAYKKLRKIYVVNYDWCSSQPREMRASLVCAELAFSESSEICGSLNSLTLPCFGGTVSTFNNEHKHA